MKKTIFILLFAFTSMFTSHFVSAHDQRGWDQGRHHHYDKPAHHHSKNWRKKHKRHMRKHHHNDFYYSDRRKHYKAYKKFLRHYYRWPKYGYRDDYSGRRHRDGYGDRHDRKRRRDD